MFIKLRHFRKCLTSQKLKHFLCETITILQLFLFWSSMIYVIILFWNEQQIEKILPWGNLPSNFKIIHTGQNSGRWEGPTFLSCIAFFVKFFLKKMFQGSYVILSLSPWGGEGASMREGTYKCFPKFLAGVHVLAGAHFCCVL